MTIYVLLLLTTISLPLTTCGERSALIIIDVQYCFMPAGSLPVPGGDTVSRDINALRTRYEFDMVLLSQDWHCKDHVSFASQHKGYQPNDMIDLQYNHEGELCRSKNVTNDFTVNCTEVSHQLSQQLWPDHCVIASDSAKFDDNLVVKESDVIVQKGYKCHIDSYSAFFDNGGFSQTELDSVLEKNDIDSVYFTGLAVDYCVSWSAMDAKKLGYRSYVVMDACRNITQEGADLAVQQMLDQGVILTHSDQLPLSPQVEPFNTAATYTHSSTLLLSMVTASVIMSYLN